MISESQHFYFDGRKSTEFGIINVQVGSELYNEPMLATRTINEVYIRGRKEPYFIDVDEQPISFELKFGFLEPWNDRLIDEVLRWLNVTNYKPFYFEGNIDKVYYVMPVDGIEKIHNGLKQGYLELRMRTDSGRAYSHSITSKIYDTSNLGKIQNTKYPIIEIGNRGHHPIYPQIWIEKIGDGDIEIYNKSNDNKLFRFKNIEKGEKLFIDCSNEIIQTSKKNTYRYDDFNDEYLKIVYGVNQLAVSNNMKIEFAYRYIFS